MADLWVLRKAGETAWTKVDRKAGKKGILMAEMTGGWKVG